MKRIIYILLIMTLILSLCACGKKDKNTPTQELGEPVGDTAIFNEDSKQYTSENLPKEYENNDFDGDRIKNKDEIKNGTDMYKVDTDGDGISDYDEIKNTKTNPTKWSSRDDDMSDLEYSIINNGEFKEGYTSTDANNFKVYLAKAEDRLYVITKTSTDVFNDLETISEAFQIKKFSGKIALNVNKYTQDVADSIAIYKDVNGKATKVQTTVTEDRLVEFNLSENDIFVIVYEEKK